MPPVPVPGLSLDCLTATLAPHNRQSEIPGTATHRPTFQVDMLMQEVELLRKEIAVLKQASTTNQTGLHPLLSFWQVASAYRYC